MVKEKRCGKIKGRTIAYGRPQQRIYIEEETSLPTVSTYALRMSIQNDAEEHRDVATADIARAYLDAWMGDFAHLKMEGKSVDILCNVCKEYKKLVCYLLDIGDLQDRYYNQHILQLCKEWDIKVKDAFEFAMKEGWGVCPLECGQICWSSKNMRYCGSFPPCIESIKEKCFAVPTFNYCTTCSICNASLLVVYFCESFYSWLTLCT
jgi:hypothetical protein